MDIEDLQSLVEDLSENIDDLETALSPLLKTALSASTSKLPLLDKAKLYVLATYAIESLLFSALRLNGVDAKTHPVFQELSRVKEYFAKIKIAETGPMKRTAALDKDAAGRFIKAGLAGNDRFDRERADRQAREKAGVKRKLEDMQGVGSHIRFHDASKTVRGAEGEVNGETPGELQARRVTEGKQRRREERERAKGAAVEDGEDGDEDVAVSKTKRGKSSKAPKSHSEAFQTLVGDASSEVEDKKHKRKKRKSHQVVVEGAVQ